MNRPTGGGGDPRRKTGTRRPGSKIGSRKGSPAASPRPAGRPSRSQTGAKPAPFRIIEREVVTAESETAPPEPRPFRVLIAVHRPRYRGRAERAAALVGWKVTALLNKQDAVGQVSKAPGPPDLFLLSGDFGRQRDYAIFRAVQKWRAEGMTLIGLVDDCAEAPEGFPDSAPEKLCDICLTPPYKTAELRQLLAGLYEAKRGKPAPPPKTAADREEDEENDF